MTFTSEAAMRVSTVVAISLLLLPAALEAQRIPGVRIGSRGPARPVPLSPQPGEIARELAYKRLRLSVETYPLVSRFDTPGINGSGVLSSWTSFGMGTRADYRVARNISATFDVTSAMFGGPALTSTAELGTRLRPMRRDRKLYPFVDLRFGYVAAYNSSIRPLDDGFGFPGGQPNFSARFSRGLGGVGGAGVEYDLTRRFSLTTAGSVMQSRMKAYDLYGARTANDTYAMMSYRWTVGLRYNPVRMIQQPGTGER